MLTSTVLYCNGKCFLSRVWINEWYTEVGVGCSHYCLLPPYRARAKCCRTMSLPSGFVRGQPSWVISLVRSSLLQPTDRGGGLGIPPPTGVPRSHGREGVRGGNSFPGPYLAFDSVTPIEGFGVRILARRGVNPNLTLNSAPPLF